MRIQVSKVRSSFRLPVNRYTGCRLSEKEIRMSAQVKLKFATSEQTSPLQLSQFLQLFVTTYRALENISESSPNEFTEYKIPTEGLFSCLKYKDIKRCIDSTSFNTDPQITAINQQSPIEIAIAGSIILLTMAAILSGGNQKISLGPVKFEYSLNSLGESITNLKRGLTNNTSLRTDYEFIGGKIKLNKEEYSYLNKEVNMNGGFQRFMRELQTRIKPKSRVIELSNRDIDRILKYKSNPNKGGFQSRFNKIFGRHFS